MNHYGMLQRIKEIYEQKKNVIRYLKDIDQRHHNSIEDIMISYDLQAGNYTRAYEREPNLRLAISKIIASTIEDLGKFSSLLEVGVGEATTLGPVLMHMDHDPSEVFGFDLSWSRIKAARKFIRQFECRATLFTGDLFQAPIKDHAIDIVFTCHGIEPNGGKEREALQELYRIARKYVVLFEPTYELADEKARSRMVEHGYITNLYGTAKELGYDIVEYRLLDVHLNPLNPTAAMIIKVKADDSADGDPICCPITRTDLIRHDDAWYSQESLLAYPVLGGIPCLTPQNAIIASKFMDE